MSTEEKKSWDFEAGTIYTQKDKHRQQFTDIYGSNYAIVQPKNEENLAKALKYLNTKNLNIIIKSGTHGTKRKNASGKVVLNLSKWQNISSTKNGIVTQTGATIEGFAKWLRAKKLFLPLPDNGYKTVGTILLSDNVGSFPVNFGTLCTYIIGCSGYNKDGEKVTLEKYDAKKISVLVSITWKAVEARAFEKKKTFVTYASKHVKKGDIGNTLSALAKLSIDSNLDISWELQNELASIPIIKVMVAGKDKKEQEKAVGCVFEKNQIVTYAKTAKIVDQMGSHHGVLHFGKHPLSKKTCTEISMEVWDEIDNSIEKIVSKNIQVLLSIKRLKEKMYQVEILTNDEMKEQSKLKNWKKISEFFNWSEKSSKTVTFSKTEDVLKTLRAQMESRKSTFCKKNTKKEISIPDGFKGDVTFPELVTDEVLEQYATSSYGISTKTQRMLPALVAFPVDANDVNLMVKLAQANGLKVVARSGGHQYCGLSSGGSDTILLVMDNLQNISLDADTFDNPRVTLGPGCRLRNIATAFAQFEMTVPHGECPLVGIGGHCQSGGYGHLLRSFGCCLDYIVSLEVVTAEGIKRVSRDSTVQREKNLFKAVCGGGPGSFGIITEIVFEPIQDKDHLKSSSYGGLFWYSKELWRSLLTEVQNWTVLERAGKLPQGADLMSTVYQKPLSIGEIGVPSVILIEYVALNYNARQFVEASLERIGIELTYKSVNGAELTESPLSAINLSFVRPLDNLIKEGREFNIPYEKRLSCTNDPLTDEFIDEFVDLVEATIQEDGLRMVFQMTLGGGEYAQKGNNGNNFLAHRDASIGIVYDVFYKENHRYDAIKKQLEFGEKVSPTLGQDVRMQWGSFGHEDEITMSHREVQNWYYGNGTLYSTLQQIKQDWDSDDIFHSQFTVTLPNTDTTWVKDSGSLKIKLDNASDLPNKDWGFSNKSDPFFMIYLEDKVESKIVNDTLNPDFGGQDLTLKADSLSKDTLTLVCWDSDVLGLKEYMCSTSVPLASLVNDNSLNNTDWTSVVIQLNEESHQGDEERMFQEETVIGDNQGTIALRLKWEPTTEATKKKTEKKKTEKKKTEKKKTETEPEPEKKKAETKPEKKTKVKSTSGSFLTPFQTVLFLGIQYLALSWFQQKNK